MGGSGGACAEVQQKLRVEMYSHINMSSDDPEQQESGRFPGSASLSMGKLRPVEKHCENLDIISFNVSVRLIDIRIWKHVVESIDGLQGECKNRNSR